MLSAFDRIDKQHKPPPRIALQAFEEGQDCPMPRCDGKLERKPLGSCCCEVIAPCYGCENARLGCSAPSCSWIEPEVWP